MSTAEFAAFSDNAIMFASIVYVLAFLAHLAEWVVLRSLPVPAEEPRSLGGKCPVVEPVEPMISPSAQPGRSISRVRSMSRRRVR